VKAVVVRELAPIDRITVGELPYPARVTGLSVGDRVWPPAARPLQE
jgi:hypothetical protein